MDTDTAVKAMLAIASNEWDEAATEAWLRTRIVAAEDFDDRR